MFPVHLSSLKSRIPLLGAFLLLSSCAAQAGRREMGPPPGFADNLDEKKFIAVPGVPGIGGFSQAIKIGKRVYISGQVALDAEGNLVGESDLAAQASRIFQNLRAVLQAAGATPEEVVQLDFMVVGLKAGDLDLIQRADTVFFPAGRHPVGSIVGVNALPVSGALLAVSAQAETKGLFPDRLEMERFRSR